MTHFCKIWDNAGSLKVHNSLHTFFHQCLFYKCKKYPLLYEPYILLLKNVTAACLRYRCSMCSWRPCHLQGITKWILVSTKHSLTDYEKKLSAQFGPRSLLFTSVSNCLELHCWSWSGSKRFAKVISRWQKSPRETVWSAPCYSHQRQTVNGQNVDPDWGSNCLPRLTTDDKSRSEQGIS